MYHRVGRVYCSLGREESQVVYDMCPICVGLNQMPRPGSRSGHGQASYADCWHFLYAIRFKLDYPEKRNTSCIYLYPLMLHTVKKKYMNQNIPSAV